MTDPDFFAQLALDPDALVTWLLDPKPQPGDTEPEPQTFFVAGPKPEPAEPEPPTFFVAAAG